MSFARTAYSDLLDDMHSEFDSFKIVWKKDSWLMKFISGFLRVITFNQQKTFLTQYITTIGYTVYVPDSWSEGEDVGRIVTLRHERVHMRQRRSLTMPLYTFLYLLCPLPLGLAYFRAKFEMEAYEETLKALVELLASGEAIIKHPDYRARLIENFTGAGYFWMWPFRGYMERWYDKAVEKALAAQPAE